MGVLHNILLLGLSPQTSGSARRLRSRDAINSRQINLHDAHMTRLMTLVESLTMLLGQKLSIITRSQNLSSFG